VNRRAAALLAAALLAAGCGASTPDAQPASGRDELTGTLTVFAAASLTDVFEDLGDQLTGEHPDLEIRFNFAGSSALATQVLQGAPVDVLASAAEPQMQLVVDEDLTREPVVFTSNVLQIAVPEGNPAGITSLADFARAELALALCSPDVPCGSAAEQLFAAAGVQPRPDTLEEDVRAALTKVELGEVDAALVYASDVVSAGGAVEGIEVPEAADAVNRYPIAVLDDAPNPAAAEAFVALVRSGDGQRALADAGFRAP
jgi:molybdate transport system substrate-binding protein